MSGRVHQQPALRDQVGVFADRKEAGEILAGMLSHVAEEKPVVLAIPAGGVPVAVEIARRLKAPLSLLVTSKATPAWNTEVGFGAVAFDGTEVVNREAVNQLGLNEVEVKAGLERAREKVERRFQRFLGEAGMPEVKGRTVILVDDGLATGYTMEAAIRALRNLGAGRIIVAVPTAHRQAVRRIAELVDELYCPNIRGGWVFAVAEAYRHWHDVGEDEVAALLRAFAAEEKRAGS